MTRMGFAYQGEEKGIAKAVQNLDISPKKAYEVSHAIRGKKIAAAKNYLNAVLEKKAAIPFKKYNRGGVGHRPGIGPGRYPQKETKAFIKLLDLVSANARYKGLSEGKLTIHHVATHRGFIQIGRRKGGQHNNRTTNVEIVVKESSK